MINVSPSHMHEEDKLDAAGIWFAIRALTNGHFDGFRGVSRWTDPRAAMVLYALTEVNGVCELLTYPNRKTTQNTTPPRTHSPAVESVERI